MEKTNGIQTVQGVIRSGDIDPAPELYFIIHREQKTLVEIPLTKTKPDAVTFYPTMDGVLEVAINMVTMFGVGTIVDIYRVSSGLLSNTNFTMFAMRVHRSTETEIQTLTLDLINPVIKTEESAQ